MVTVKSRIIKGAIFKSYQIVDVMVGTPFLKIQCLKCNDIFFIEEAKFIKINQSSRDVHCVNCYELERYERLCASELLQPIRNIVSFKPIFDGEKDLKVSWDCKCGNTGIYYYKDLKPLRNSSTKALLCRDCKEQYKKVFVKEEEMKKYGIKKFPHYRNGVKFIDMLPDKGHYRWKLIKECIHCKNHTIFYTTELKKAKNPSISKPYCGHCKVLEEKVDIVKGKYVHVKHKTYKNGSAATFFEVRVTNLRIPYMNNFYKVEKTLTEEEINQYRIIFNYQVDDFIRHHNLKFPKTYNEEQFKKIKEYVKGLKEDFPKPTVFMENIQKNYNNIRLSYRHTFMANIEKFSSRPDTRNASWPVPTVLFENISFSNGVSFRDHAWADFHPNEYKGGELKPGYLVKFEGYVYDYKRNYDGVKTDKIFSQSIGRIRNIEIISTGQRKDF